MCDKMKYFIFQTYKVIDEINNFDLVVYKARSKIDLFIILRNENRVILYLEEITELEYYKFVRKSK